MSTEYNAGLRAGMERAAGIAKRCHTTWMLRAGRNKTVKPRNLAEGAMEVADAILAAIEMPHEATAASAAPSDAGGKEGRS